MSQYTISAIYPLFLWWFSTGIVMYIVRLPQWTFRWSLLTASIVLFASLYGLAASSRDQSIAGAYITFTLALLIWGTQEIGFLTGYVTGPRPLPCPPQCSRRQKFSLALQAILYHELALLLTGFAIAAVAWGAPNQIGTYTFLLLWTMRLSSKLNLFLGVQYLSLEFLPKHLAFVGSFFAKRPMNMLFPLSITASTAVTTLLIVQTFKTQAVPYESTGFCLLAVLMALAVLEHWFMFLPLPILALWAWSRGPREKTVIAPPQENSPAKLARERLEAKFRKAYFEQKAQSASSPAGVDSSRHTPVQTADARFP